MATLPASNWSPGQGQAFSLSSLHRAADPGTLGREACVTELSALPRKVQHPGISLQQHPLQIFKTLCNQKDAAFPYRLTVQGHDSGHKVGLVGLHPSSVRL